MFRAFDITIADTNAHNLFSLIVGSVYGVAQGGTNETGITGAIPSSGIFPDNVASLFLIPPAGGASVGDFNNANSGFCPLPTAGLTLTQVASHLNLKEILVKLTTGGQALGVVVVI